MKSCLRVRSFPILSTGRALRAVFAPPKIPLPADIFAGQRRNSRGINFASESQQVELAGQMAGFAICQWKAAPVGGAGLATGETAKSARRPIERRGGLGDARRSPQPPKPRWMPRDGPAGLGRHAGRPARRVPGTHGRPARRKSGRADGLCVREAGKTLIDGINEVREAADFCRYYAQMARRHFGRPEVLAGPTGEHNEVSLHGKGVFVCISPWNFPVAIFTGQVAAALASGNAAIAKPAEQTPLLAARTIELFYQAGVPEGVLQMLPGDGRVGAALTADPRIAGVAFTGSTEVARIINRKLAERDGPIATLIAETGGQNAMIVDSSALAEQVVRDVIQSSFLSAGQRCSALRVLYIQRDVADHVLEMLAGAMQELAVGWPGRLATDIGPVIDEAQLDMLRRHAQRMEREAKAIARVPDPADAAEGFWFAPRAFELESIDQLNGEVFGPILHVVRYRARDLDRVIDEINATGYGLTVGCHSRIDQVQQHVINNVHAGNAYVNRNMTGAVVGVQPFGGEGLSGTGPKAGGPNYLQRFAVERTRTVNTAAVGGNASLMVLSD